MPRFWGLFGMGKLQLMTQQRFESVCNDAVTLKFFKTYPIPPQTLSQRRNQDGCSSIISKGNEKIQRCPTDHMARAVCERRCEGWHYVNFIVEGRSIERNRCDNERAGKHIIVIVDSPFKCDWIYDTWGGGRSPDAKAFAGERGQHTSWRNRAVGLR